MITASRKDDSYSTAFLREVLKTDFSSFARYAFQITSPGIDYQHNWHIDAMAWHLGQCMTGRIRRLIITVPPRHLKSHLASVCLPAFILGHDPTRRIISVSYGQDLSDKFARDCLHLVRSQAYRQLFPKTLIDSRKAAVGEFMTTRQGFRLATSVGGVLTGRGGDILILDDPMKPDEAMSEAHRRAVIEWYHGTLLSRLDSKKDGVIIIVMQRLHQEDLVGHVLENGEDWTVLNLPAIAPFEQQVATGPGEYHLRLQGDVLHPEREPAETLEKTRVALGTAIFSAQYQQDPLGETGNLVNVNWFRTTPEGFGRQPGDRLIQSWDTAVKAGELNDYSVCMTVLKRGEEYYIVDVLRRRMEFPELLRAARDQAKGWDADTVLIEDKGSGTGLLQMLEQAAMRPWPTPVKCRQDKVTRMSGCSAIIEAGQVFLPAAAPWLDDFRQELMAFPYGKHDDQVDALSQLLNWEIEQDLNQITMGEVIGHY